MQTYPQRTITLVTLALALSVGVVAACAQQQPLSPRGSAETTINGKKITVDYGRPSMRGRKIFGALVPYGQVWRTGANKATHFTTETDLIIGGVTVPKGTYTLYTLPAENGWKLILNKQTGQWGTQYDQSQDLARVDLKVTKTSTPVEQFTISFAPAKGGAVMKFEWENTSASVDLKAK